MISMLELVSVIYMILYWALFSSLKGFVPQSYTAERVFNEVNTCTKSCIVLEDEKARRGVMLQI